GVKLGFSFPAGVQVSELAEKCTESIRPKTSVRGTVCSLSGLENQCNTLLQKGMSPEYVCKYCLLCVGETVLKMVKAALQEYHSVPVVFAGGVMSSSVISEYVRVRLPGVHFVPGKFSSDNAIGAAVLASREFGSW
ncbi:glycoprotease family protein, partial [gut metagenome]